MNEDINMGAYIVLAISFILYNRFYSKYEVRTITLFSLSMVIITNGILFVYHSTGYHNEHHHHEHNHEHKHASCII